MKKIYIICVIVGLIIAAIDIFILKEGGLTGVILFGIIVELPLLWEDEE